MAYSLWLIGFAICYTLYFLSRYISTIKTTQENSVKFTMLNSLNTISSDTKPDGAIKMIQAHTPKAQERLISAEDLRRTIFMINGTFHNGMATAPTTPKIWTTFILFPFLSRFDKFYQLVVPLMDILHRQAGSLTDAETRHIKRRAGCAE